MTLAPMETDKMEIESSNKSEKRAEKIDELFKEPEKVSRNFSTTKSIRQSLPKENSKKFLVNMDF